MTREPTLAEMAAAGIPLSLTPPFDFERIPLPLDILDSLVEHYLPFASSWVEFDREEITGGSILYKMRQFQLGELGTIKLRKTGPQESAMEVSSSPSASSRNFTSEEKAAVKAREMQPMDILQQIQGERDDLNRRRKKHQADVIKGLFNRLARDLTWQKHWGDLAQRTPTPAEDTGSQHTTHIDKVNGPMHTGQGDINIYLTSPEKHPKMLTEDGAGEEEAPGETGLASLHRQLTEARENLRLIQERKSQYVLETDIPLQLIKEERRLLERIEELEKRIEEKRRDTRAE